MCRYGYVWLCPAQHKAQACARCACIYLANPHDVYMNMYTCICACRPAQHTAQACARCREGVEGGELPRGGSPQVSLAEGTAHAQLGRGQVAESLQVACYGLVCAATGKE